MAGNKALEYAEKDLGVHTVHEEAHQLTNEAATLRQKIATLRRQKVDVEALYHDAEFNFISDLRGANQHMSQTAFDKHAKIEVHRDASLRTMRGSLANDAEQIERAEADLSTLKLRIEIAVARMHELGGYLNYLSAVKNAAVYKQGVDWPPDYRPGASAPQSTG